MSADVDASIRREVAAASGRRGPNIFAGSKWISGRVGQGVFFSLGSAAERIIDVGQLSKAYRAVESFKKRKSQG